MFSVQYLDALSQKTGFQREGLQKQMTLLTILKEINQHPLLKTKYILRGGTAINLLWFPLPRLSVDIDLNYIDSADIEVMKNDREKLEKEIAKLLVAKSITVQYLPSEHAGGKWRLRTRSAFGGDFTLELDLNYLMRTPIWGLMKKRPFPLDEDLIFDCYTVSFEELFAGKIKALLDRSAARDLYDVAKLSELVIHYDVQKLKKNLILFGLTVKSDWRKKTFDTIDGIDQKMIHEQLTPLLRTSERINLPEMKKKVIYFLTPLMSYDVDEKKFLNRFYDDGEYEPELLFSDTVQSELLRKHPAVLWKLMNHRKNAGL